MRLPRFVKIRQRFAGPALHDLEAAVNEQCRRIQASRPVKPGMKIAITAGSRGIANIAVIIKCVVDHLKALGAEPRIIPTMGSHGGATAEGQADILHSLGITEPYCGAPILSSMDVVQVGETPEGLPVYADRHIAASDGVILVARVKSHTDFTSAIGIESGLLKMAAIGIGKHRQALLLHSYGIRGIRDLMPAVGQVVLDKVNVLFGLGIVENAFDETAIIEAIEPKQIVRRERELLQRSKELMPRLPVEDIDVLIVDEIGKNFSGTGMDTNIIGRMRILGEAEPAGPRIKYIIAGDLSPASHGNALGIGLADITTRRLFDQIDMKTMNENVITSSFLQRGMIPLVADNDRDALQIALRCNWGVTPANAKILRIPNTLQLQHAYASEALVPELGQLGHVEVTSEPEPLVFDEAGYLRKSDWTGHRPT